LIQKILTFIIIFIQKEVTLGFEFYKESYAGSVKEIVLGKGDKAVTVGGETCYPFYQFEGEMPNKPRIAMEIWDTEPEEWPEAVIEPFKEVLSDPAAWAKKCVVEYGAEMIVLQLKSTDPNDKDASPGEAAATVKKVLDAIDVPLIVWGTANVEKDEIVLKKISEECQGANLIIGPVEDKNHKGIGAAAMGFGHTIISSSPIDVNLAKQVNILLENLGMPMDRVIVDPTTGGGHGFFAGRGPGSSLFLHPRLTFFDSLPAEIFNLGVGFGLGLCLCLGVRFRLGLGVCFCLGLGFCFRFGFSFCFRLCFGFRRYLGLVFSFRLCPGFSFRIYLWLGFCFSFGGGGLGAAFFFGAGAVFFSAAGLGAAFLAGAAFLLFSSSMVRSGSGAMAARSMFTSSSSFLIPATSPAEPPSATRSI